MRKVLKCILSLLFVCLLSSQLFAADGTITYVKGKVEVKRGDSWVSLRVGDSVSESEIINTGFQSEAKVKLMDSVLYLGPVTRVSLDQLSSSSDRDKVNVYLSTGTIRSKVNRTNDKSVSYTVRTPIAVASVRGTDFSMGSDGTVVTNEGKVAYSLDVNDDDDESDDEDDDDEDDEDDEEKKKTDLSEEEKDDESDSDDESSENGDSGSESEKGSKSDKAKSEESGDKADKAKSEESGSKADKAKSEESVNKSDVADDKGSSASAEKKSEAVASKPSQGGSRVHKKSDTEIKMEESKGLPKETLVGVNQSMSEKSARNLQSAVSNTANAAMNVVGSVSSEGSKSGVGQTTSSVVTAVSNSITSGNAVVVVPPKTGSIKVQITEPAVGNVSVEVVLPK